jgi:hypothetical protein
VNSDAERTIMQSTPHDRRTRRFRKVVEYAFLAAVVLLWLRILGILTFNRYHPPEGTTTVDQLVAHLPETLKFALVEEGNRSYVVWVGRPSGALVSGPPVYVFDRTGALVDRVGDSGDSDNTFVRRLHAEACRAPAITPQEALAYCRRWKSAGS